MLSGKFINCQFPYYSADGTEVHTKQVEAMMVQKPIIIVCAKTITSVLQHWCSSYEHFTPLSISST